VKTGTEGRCSLSSPIAKALPAQRLFGAAVPKVPYRAPGWGTTEKMGIVGGAHPVDDEEMGRDEGTGGRD
jgi:hypothetical protein